MGLFAHERGTLTKLSQLVESMNPSEKTTDWDDEESDNLSSLREVICFSLVLAMFSDVLFRQP